MSKPKPHVVALDAARVVVKSAPGELGQDAIAEHVRKREVVTSSSTMKSRHIASFAEGKWTSGADSTLLLGDWQAWVDGEGHWKVRGPDPDNAASYADGDIALTEAEYIEAGNSEVRRKIRAQRAKKAARAYIAARGALHEGTPRDPPRDPPTTDPGRSAPRG